MVYRDMSEEEIAAKQAKMDALAVAAVTLMHMGQEDKELTRRFAEVWDLAIAEERLEAPKLAAYTKFTMEIGAAIATGIGRGAPAEFAHAVSVGLQVGHDYVVKYGKLLED